MSVKRLQSTCYVVAEMERTLSFYRDVLGLALKFRDGSRWAQFDVGGAGLALCSPGEGAVTPGAGAVVTLEDGRTMTIRDPDGNVVQLYQRAGK